MQRPFSKTDEWMTCDFRFFSTVLQLYEDDGMVIIKAMCTGTASVAVLFLLLHSIYAGRREREREKERERERDCVSRSNNVLYTSLTQLRLINFSYLCFSYLSLKETKVNKCCRLYCGDC